MIISDKVVSKKLWDRLGATALLVAFLWGGYKGSETAGDTLVGNSINTALAEETAKIQTAFAHTPAAQQEVFLQAQLQETLKALKNGNPEDQKHAAEMERILNLPPDDSAAELRQILEGQIKALKQGSPKDKKLASGVETLLQEQHDNSQKEGRDVLELVGGLLAAGCIPGSVACAMQLLADTRFRSRIRAADQRRAAERG